MLRTLIPILLLLCAALPAAAHDPPRPVTDCQPQAGEALHDYLPPSHGLFAAANDGNLHDCRPGDQRVLDPSGFECAWLALTPAYPYLCQPIPGSDAPLDYDGEMDHGEGGALLAVVTGDGTTNGALACYGMEGHHTSTIHAQEWPDNTGPSFLILSDQPRATTNPDHLRCGDGVVEVCGGPMGPADPPMPFPLQDAADLVDETMDDLLGPGSSSRCNPNDCIEIVPSNPLGPSGVTTACSPGRDGSYWIYVQPDAWPAPDAPVMGHVWTM